MQGVATIDLADGFVDRLIAALVEWFAPRDGTSESDQVERAVRKLIDPIVAATNETELDLAFSAASHNLPEFVRAMSRLPMFVGQRTQDAIGKLPWLIEHVAGDLDAGASPHEFLALLLFHLRIFERAIAQAPRHVVERAAAMSDEDIQVAQRDPMGVALFEAVTALLALGSIHERLGRADTWRRLRVLTRGLHGLQSSASLLREERSFAWTRWYFQTLRDLGIWLKTALPSTQPFDVALQRSPPNRTALETLRARFEAAGKFVYVGDVQGTFEQVLGGEDFFRELDARLEAGERFERAELSIDELARRWSLDVTDMVAQLEELRIVRPLDVLRLTDDDRRLRLAKLRADRLTRRGEPALDQNAVRRSVVASQRIEGIDARGHLRGTARERS